MTATAVRAPNGRYAKQPAPVTHCAECGWTLYADLAGRLKCVHRSCENFRVVVGTLPGIDVGLLGEALGVEET